MIKNKKILIIGMARSGISIAKLLRKYNNEIVLNDSKDQDQSIVKELEALGIKVVITEDDYKLLDESIDLVIKNPGVRKDKEVILKAKELNIPVINEVEASYQFLPKDTNIITVTGSNGKTTTTTIIYELLKYRYNNVHLGGNIGIPVSNLVEETKEGDILVLKISDHQLLDMYNFKSNISVLTNLSEVHLDFHGNYENYKNTKKKIFNNHTKSDIAILNKDNEDVINITEDIPSTKIYFSSTKEADCYLKDNKIIYNNEEIIDTKDILIKGKHNYENIMCAIAATKQLNISNETIKEVLSNFYGVEHRIEYVKTVNGVEFYNDSKATNVKSTEIALNSFSNPTILILGGLDRHHSFDDLKDDLDHVKYIVCYGETKFRIKDFCDSIDKPCIVVDNLREAVRVAYSKSESGYTVLLSPACASWDQYDNFEIRGSEFKDEVNKLV